MPDLDDEIAVTRWAFALPSAERGRLLLAVANVLAAEDLRERPRAKALLDPLLPALAKDAPAEMSAELARRLLDAAWAPDGLLIDLAFATDADLAPVIAQAGGLSDPVASRLAADGGPDARLILAKRSALPGAALDALVTAARREPALRAPLVRHAQLSPEQAEQLQTFVGPELRGELATRFELAPAAAAGPDGETEARLLEKLDRAGRLTPSYALSALRRGRLGLFQQAVARLGGMEPGAVQQAVANDRATGLALACAASGIDRAVFPVVLGEVAGLTGRAGFSRPGGAEVAAAFRRPPAEAARVLRTRARRSAARWKAGPAA